MDDGFDKRLLAIDDSVSSVENKLCSLREKPFSFVKRTILKQDGGGLQSIFDALQAIRNELLALSGEHDSLIETIASRRATVIRTQISFLTNYLNHARDEGKKVVCVLAPMYDETNVHDGFFRRVKAVDALFDKRAVRLYLSRSGEQTMRMVFHDENHIALSFNYYEDIYTSIFETLSDAVDVVYCHSVHHYVNEFFKKEGVQRIIDVHGVVPEESLMSGDEADAQKFAQREASVMAQADIAVVVSNAMAQHLMSKYPNRTPSFLLLPIFDDDAFCDAVVPAVRAYEHGKPVVTYAGGFHVWQCLDQMCDVIEAARDCASFYIFVPDVLRFQKLWGVRRAPECFYIGSRTPEEMKQEYARCHYGFVLREDVLVNNVACPTKLTEYLLNGVIPIVSSPEIGDFKKDGYRYITVDEFSNGELPDEATRVQMAQDNFELVCSMHDHSIETKARLKDDFFSAVRRDCGEFE